MNAYSSHLCASYGFTGSAGAGFVICVPTWHSGIQISRHVTATLFQHVPDLQTLRSALPQWIALRMATGLHRAPPGRV